MQTMSIKKARAQLSRLVDLAERGQTVVIVRRGKKSARLGPVAAGRKPLPSLREFRARIGRPATGLSRTVVAARRAERF